VDLYLSAMLAPAGLRRAVGPQLPDVEMTALGHGLTTCADAAGPDRGKPFAVDEGSQPVGNQAFADTVGAREEERTRTCAVAPAGLEALEDILVADQFERRA